MTSVVPNVTRVTSSRAHRTIANIMDAGRTVFARDGFAGAEVRAIVEEAGTSRTTFYTYFASKEELLREMIAELLPELMRSGPKTGGQLTPELARERIHATNVAYLDAYARNADLMRVWAEAATRSPEINQLLHEARQPFLLRTSHSIRHLQQEGLADPDLDAEYCAIALVGMVTQFAFSWFVEDEDYDRERAAKTLTSLWVNAIRLERADES